MQPHKSVDAPSKLRNSPSSAVMPPNSFAAPVRLASGEKVLRNLVQRWPAVVAIAAAWSAFAIWEEHFHRCSRGFIKIDLCPFVWGCACTLFSILVLAFSLALPDAVARSVRRWSMVVAGAGVLAALGTLPFAEFWIRVLNAVDGML